MLILNRTSWDIVKSKSLASEIGTYGQILIFLHQQPSETDGDNTNHADVLIEDKSQSIAESLGRAIN